MSVTIESVGLSVDEALQIVRELKKAQISFQFKIVNFPLINNYLYDRRLQITFDEDGEALVFLLKHGSDVKVIKGE